MFYEQFRALCKIRNETPSHVLESIGLTRMNASLWKKGGMPSAENIQKLANYFGVPVDYLLNTNAAMSANSSNMHRIISDAEIAKNQILLENLVKELDEIPKQNKRNAISEIEADKIMLDELIKAMEIIPKQYRPAAIHDMTTFAEFVISKYTALAANSNENQIKQVDTKPGET